VSEESHRIAKAVALEWWFSRHSMDWRLEGLIAEAIDAAVARARAEAPVRGERVSATPEHAAAEAVHRILCNSTNHHRMCYEAWESVDAAPPAGVGNE
jgi:hypothetical protein